jgi:hypothetical protein
MGNGWITRSVLVSIEDFEVDRPVDTTALDDDSAASYIPKKFEIEFATREHSN